MSDPWQEIYKSTLKFLVPLETKQTYQVISKEALRLVGGGYASIFLFRGGELKRVYTTHKELKGIIPRLEGITYEVFRTKVPHLRNKDGLVSANKKFGNLPVQSNITIPLNYGHITFGVLSVISKKGKILTKDDLETLSLFGPVATLAIRKTQLLQEAETAVEARNLLISLADHEVKNSLTSIMLNLESLKKSKDLQKKKEFKYIKRLDRLVKGINNTVDEFLQSDRLKFANMKYNFTNENIVTICNQVIKDFILSYKSYNFSFTNLTNKNKVLVKSDNEKINQVLVNLINNAIKFSPQNSKVEISIESNKKLVTVNVKDNGVGISKKDLAKVFKKYYRGRTQEKGMGLGLYLAQEIISKHDGIVKIDSVIDKGTKVSFSLPILEL